MEVLSTYIYELKKGSKSCALMTFEYEKLKDAILKIKKLYQFGGTLVFLSRNYIISGVILKV